MSLQKYRLKTDKLFPLQGATPGPQWSSTYIMMATSDLKEILNRIKEEAKIAPPWHPT